MGATIHQAKFVREKEKLVDGHDSPRLFITLSSERQLIIPCGAWITI
jgi:hypothetical protein